MIKQKPPVKKDLQSIIEDLETVIEVLDENRKRLNEYIESLRRRKETQ